MAFQTANLGTTLVKVNDLPPVTIINRTDYLLLTLDL